METENQVQRFGGQKQYTQKFDNPYATDSQNIDLPR